MTGTRAHAAAQRLAGLGYGPAGAAGVVTTVLDVLRDPDRDMLDAGVTELNTALGPVTDRPHGTAYRRDLVRVIWHAMLDRAK